MPSSRNRRFLPALGLCLAAAAFVAIPEIGTFASGDSPVYGSQRDVAEVQAILQHAGYLAPGACRMGEVDAPTAQALRSFQRAHNLRPTGSVDYETRTQLLSHGRGVDGEAVHRTARSDGGAPLVLNGVEFDSGTARLRPGARATLDRVARSLNASPEARVQIAGHTDSTNTDAYNRRLSQARSAAVCEYLVDKGVASSQLREKGYGESRPIADNTTAAGRAANRRVELIRID